MGLLKRAKVIAQAKGNAWMDQFEDPTQMAALGLEKLQEMRAELQGALANVAGARRQQENQYAQLEAQHGKLELQAKAALAQGNEELAREALTRATALESAMAAVTEGLTHVQAEEEKLTRVNQQLGQRIEMLKIQNTTDAARWTGAKAMNAAGEAAAGIGSQMGDIGAAMARGHDKIAAMEARGDAIDELLSSGALSDVAGITGSQDDIQRQLDQASATSGVDAKLAAMKAQLSGGSAPAALPAAQPAVQALPAAPAHKSGQFDPSAF